MKAVTILGGGLSGLVLGIGLRQRSVPVRILEAGQYPRHKVCGEYLSGRGRKVLQSLGLEAVLFQEGACEAESATFSQHQASTLPRALPQRALCVSRWTMDAVLAWEFQQLGGELHTGTRAPLESAEGHVRATGRRPQMEEEGWRLFGLKAHARGVHLKAGLEMHFTPRGYVGLCAVEGGRVNVCGLFRSREPVPRLAKEWRSWLSGAPGSRLADTLLAAEWDEASFSTVAALGLSPRKAALLDDFSVGDAVTMIPPVTGNGMSMACESASAAILPLERWSRGEMTWDEARRNVAHTLDRQFSPRLSMAGWLQRAIVQPMLRSALFHCARWMPRLQDALFRLTR